MRGEGEGDREEGAEERATASMPWCICDMPQRSQVHGSCVEATGDGDGAVGAAASAVTIIAVRLHLEYVHAQHRPLKHHDCLPAFQVAAQHARTSFNRAELANFSTSRAYRRNLPTQVPVCTAGKKGGKGKKGGAGGKGGGSKGGKDAAGGKGGGAGGGGSGVGITAATLAPLLPGWCPDLDWEGDADGEAKAAEVGLALGFHRLSHSHLWC